jgi:hypothetical protein
VIFKLDLAAQVGGYLFGGFDEVVTDARAGTTARFGAHAGGALAGSFPLLFFRCRHSSALNQQNSWIVAALTAAGCGCAR